MKKLFKLLVYFLLPLAAILLVITWSYGKASVTSRNHIFVKQKLINPTTARRKIVEETKPTWTQRIPQQQTIINPPTPNPTQQVETVEILEESDMTLTQRFPQVIGIGSKKCGTGALQEFICAHPRVRCKHMETHFFDQEKSFSKGGEYYRSVMPMSGVGDITFEKTPNYFANADIPSRIKNFYQSRNISVKFILNLCDPVMRTYSDYVHLHRMKYKVSITEYESFEAFLEGEMNLIKKYLATVDLSTISVANDSLYENIFSMDWTIVMKGLYAFHLRRWLHHYPREDILIIDGDDLTTEPWIGLAKVQQFMGLPVNITKDDFLYNEERGFYCLKSDAKGMSCLGKGKGQTRKVSNNGTTVVSKMLAESSQLLSDFYRPFNKDLRELVDLEFDWLK